MLQTKCGVRQSWAACFFLVHLGCLRLGVLEPSLWWNGLGLHLKGLNHMIIWYLLEMAWPYTWKACILWVFSLERKNWVFLKKSLGSSMVLVQRIFFLYDLRAQCPLSKDFFHLKIFLFFGKDLEILIFFFEFFFLNIYMNKVHQMLHGFLEFKET